MHSISWLLQTHKWERLIFVAIERRILKNSSNCKWMLRYLSPFVLMIDAWWFQDVVAISLGVLLVTLKFDSPVHEILNLWLLRKCALVIICLSVHDRILCYGSLNLWLNCDHIIEFRFGCSSCMPEKEISGVVFRVNVHHSLWYKIKESTGSGFVEISVKSKSIIC